MRWASRTPSEVHRQFVFAESPARRSTSHGGCCRRTARRCPGFGAVRRVLRGRGRAPPGNPNALEHEPDRSGHPAESRSVRGGRHSPRRPAIVPTLAVDLGEGRRLYVHPPEDILLQKLRWYRLGGGIWTGSGGTSPRLSVQGERLDRDYLAEGAGILGVSDLLDRALAEASPGGRVNPSRGGSVLFDTRRRTRRGLGSSLNDDAEAASAGQHGARWAPAAVRLPDRPAADRRQAGRQARGPGSASPHKCAISCGSSVGRPNDLLRRVSRQFRHRHFDRFLELGV